MRREKRKFPFLSLIIICVVLFLTVGFSTFQQELLVDGVGVKVRLHEDLRVTGISYESSTSGGESTYEEYNVRDAYGGVYLPNSDSTVTYKIEITNFGNVEKGIFDIQFVPSDLARTLTYELKEIDYKEKVCDDEKCTLGATKEFYLTIKYQPYGGYNKNKLYYDIDLNFVFNGYHKISYNGFKSIGKEYPLEVMDEDSIYIPFTEDVPSKISITVDGKPYTNYTYWNSYLYTGEITGDVVITKIS